MGGNKPLRVNTMYGADGRLRTSYFEGDAAKVARKNIKAFEKELSKYEKEFATYASLDIEDAAVNDKNAQYVFGKMGIAEKYISYIPEGDMAQTMGDEMTAIAGNKNSRKLGIGTKLANAFQPFFEKQAEKHPRLQKLSDRVTKAANGGRMPLTADSAVMMRIAFDKKYYNDCRRPGADIDELRKQHDASIENLTKMAMLDGVEQDELSVKFSQKLISQMQVDETLTDIYAGMADGSIRLADAKAMRDSKGETIKIGGKTLFERSGGFVSAEKDRKGRNVPLDAWDFKTREPQTVDVILQDYQSKLDKYAQSCKTAADFKRMLSSDSYKNLERNAKTFAESDCLDDAAMFKYEFTRRNLESCKKWALEHGNRKPYANLVIPPPWNERMKDNDFVKSYATDDYYDINDKNEVHDKAADAVSKQTDEKLAEDMANEFLTDVNDLESVTERLNRLEAENMTLKEKLAQMESVSVKSEAEHEKLDSHENGASSGVSLAKKLRQEIQAQYGSESKTILDVGDEDVKKPQAEVPLMVEQKKEAELDRHFYMADNAIALSYSCDLPEETDGFDGTVTPAHTEHRTVIVPQYSALEVCDNRVVSQLHCNDDYYNLVAREYGSVTFDELSNKQLEDLFEITREQYDILAQFEAQAEAERFYYEQKEQQLEMERESGISENARSKEEIDADLDRLFVESFPSHGAHIEAIQKIRDSVPGKSGCEEPILPEIYSVSRPDLSGRIEKYDLDIDFAKIDEVGIEVQSDEYFGGYDENGYERKDNFRESNDRIYFYASPNRETLMAYDAAKGYYEEPIGISTALGRISEYLDKSKTDSNVSVYIQQMNGEKQYINSVVEAEQSKENITAKFDRNIHTNVIENKAKEDEGYER